MNSEYNLLNRKLGTRTAALSALAGFISVAGLAVAAPIAVPNSSFETPVTASFQNNTGIAAGSAIPGTTPANAWYYLGGFAATGSPVGVENTAANSGSTGGDGTQNGYINRGAFMGSAALVTIEANTTYTLTVAEARRGGGFAQTSGFTIALAFGSTAGSTTLTDSANWASSEHFGLPVTTGVFSDYTTSFTTGGSDPFIGQSLFVVLGSDNPGSGNNPVDFDNVRLDATVVPEPATFASLLCGGGLVLLRRRSA